MSIQESMVESADKGYRRKVWVLKSEEKTPRLCVFLDAEYYLDKVDAPAILARLREEKAIPAVTAVFVSNEDSPARHKDFACNERYARFVAEDIVGWARTNAGGREHGHLICGLSLSGLASAFLTLSYPEIFPLCIAQSGSFWWNKGWLARNVKSFARTQRRVWLSVGDEETVFGVSHPPSGMAQEVSQIAGVKHAAKTLEAAGAVVKYHEFHGGHAIEPWKDELPAALTWVFSG